MNGRPFEFAVAAGVVLFVTLPVVGRGQEEVVERLERIAELGPRSSRSEGQEEAQSALLLALQESNLEYVQKWSSPGPAGWTHLQGTLPGTGATEIVLSAHYDTVAASHGRLDNASGCAVAMAAAGELSQVPRQSSLEVLLFDAEEMSAEGSQAWLAAFPPQTHRVILANLNLDVVGSRRHTGAGIVHLAVGFAGGERVMTPAWLVHAVLQGAQSSGFPVSILDRRWSWFAQLAVRCAIPSQISDSRRFMEVGIPALTLSDLSLTSPSVHDLDIDGDATLVSAERLETWTKVATATVRRLDSLTDRPPAESEYLVLAGRVWIRRDLVWVGFVIWVLMVWRGLPGSWRRRSASERRRMGRSYLPGFAHRMLFVLSVFLIPTFAALLLYPVGVLGLVGSDHRRQIRCLIDVLAAAPTILFTSWLAVGQIRGWFTLDRTALLPAALVYLTLATFIGRKGEERA